VCGGTISDSFPITAGVYQQVNNGGRAEGFITLLNRSCSAILRSTYYGTPSYDQLFFVQSDRTNNIYVLGQTTDTSSAFTKNAGYNVPHSGQYITKFPYALDSIIWSTRFGTGRGQPDISPTAFLVDVCNSIYLAGWGSFIQRGAPQLSTRGLYVSPDAYQKRTDGSDFYVMVMKDDASAITYATYFGDTAAEEHVDGGTSRFDKKGVIYQSVCAGCNRNQGFPTYPANVVSPSNNSPNCNNAIFKLDLNIPLVIADFELPQTKCDTATYQFINQSKILDTPRALIRWSFGDGGSSTQLNPSHTYTRAGLYTIKLVIADGSSCNGADSISKTLLIRPNDSTISLSDVNACAGKQLMIGINPPSDTSVTFRWQPTAGISDTTITNPMITTDKPTTYQLIFTKGNCRSIYKQVVQVERDTLEVKGGNILCPRDTIKLIASDTARLALIYQWQPTAQILSGSNTRSPTVKPSRNTTYQVTATSPLGCVYRDSITVLVKSLLQNVSALATPDTINYGDSSQLSVSYLQKSTLLWNADSSLSNPLLDSPVASPHSPTTYVVTITDDNGCKVHDSVRVYLRYTPCASSNLYVPNAFTPDGDGKNDVLYVRGNFIQTMYFTVYDRWGQQVFESRNQGTGWDGTFGGKRLTPSVYGWYLEGTCDSGEHFFKKGNVTIIR
jgi:hypothetical protein